MTNYVFEILDKTERKIHLSKERWRHLKTKHPEVYDFELIRETIENPDNLKQDYFDHKVHYFYKYFKTRPKNKYFQVVVKYLNGNGFVLTAYFEKKLK